MKTDSERAADTAGSHDDFLEVAHCGGKVSFKVITKEDGARAYSVGYRGSSVTPMALSAVYALPQGIACGNIYLGGIGQPWNSAPYPDCVPVFIGSDSEGRFGHQCSECGGYWRSSGADTRLPMTCAYCGVKELAWQFLTRAQQNYVEHYVGRLMEALASDVAELEVEIDMDAVVDTAAMPKPEFYYSGETQQTRFECSACGGWNDIRGQYGYCSVCGWRNNAQRLFLDLAELREKLNDRSSAPGDTIRSAVSKFDSCCRNFVGQLCRRVPMTEGRRKALEEKLFHGLEDARETLRTAFDIDIFSGIDSDGIRFLRMMFGRRHVFEHDGGQATARYIENSGDRSVAEGTLIRETQENVHRLISLLNRMIGNLENGFHDLFPPEEKPVVRWRERKKRMQGRG